MITQDILLQDAYLRLEPSNILFTIYGAYYNDGYVSTWDTLGTSATTAQISAKLFNFTHQYQQKIGNTTIININNTNTVLTDKPSQYILRYIAQLGTNMKKMLK